jgi:SpoIID/LytB domain protein
LGDREPIVSVGLVSGAEQADFELKGEFVSQDGVRIRAGGYRARPVGGQVEIVSAGGSPHFLSSEIHLTPASRNISFIVHDVVIGINFHWQRKRDQEFQGALCFKLDPEKQLIVINEIAIEDYLISVISSEMSATSHQELLKAHSIISRSWLLAQMKSIKSGRGQVSAPAEPIGDSKQLIRWYDQESHSAFDVCADDHCQRYQGVTRATSVAVFEAVRATRGQVLSYRGELCDARFSKSCGGMTESFDAAWADVKIPYLAVSYDGESFPENFNLPLTDETNAGMWIRYSPPAYCNTEDRNLLRKVLPDFDQETVNFYRWRVVISQGELQELLHKKLGIDFGTVLELEPVKRGGSGRIIKLRIRGERETIIIGKELEIRRALSLSHLYSSAFIIETDRSIAPSHFTLIGAGWGHGVGLCQIGAALMAERGYNCEQVLAHYYRGSHLQTNYI